jgi:hypothetical protein
LCEVFNTCVDKRVEKAVFPKTNYTVLSTLTRFALFLCIRTFFGFASRANSTAIHLVYALREIQLLKTCKLFHLLVLRNACSVFFNTISGVFPNAP